MTRSPGVPSTERHRREFPAAHAVEIEVLAGITDPDDDELGHDPVVDHASAHGIQFLEVPVGIGNVNDRIALRLLCGVAARQADVQLVMASQRGRRQHSQLRIPDRVRRIGGSSCLRSCDGGVREEKSNCHCGAGDQPVQGHGIPPDKRGITTLDLIVI